MAAQDSRVGDRQTASMRIKLKYPDVETFIHKYAVNISRGGIFIATKQPKPVGTYVRFEFVLSDAETTSIIRGDGQVQWTKEYDPAQPGKPHGMGVKFSRLDPESQAVIDRALKWRTEHGTNPGLQVPNSSAHTISTATATPPPPPRQQVATPPPPPPPPLAPPPTPEPPPLVALTPPGRGETRPITFAAVEGDEDTNVGRPPNVDTRPIDVSLEMTRPKDEIDALANEWGLSEDKVARILKRARPRMVEATAELERLLLKPAKSPAPTKAEALAQLAELLKKNGHNGSY